MKAVDRILRGDSGSAWDASVYGMVALGLFALVLMTGCGKRSLSPPPPDPDPLARETYLIGVTDVLRINIWRNPELSVDVPVRPDGKISVPLLDDVQAEGLTPTELKEVLTRELEEYVASPHVTVIVLQMNSRFVSVIGGVNREGRIPLTRELRVLEAVAASGGFTTFADKNNVRVVRRQSSGMEHEYRFNYGAYIKGKAPGSNLVLANGDTIIVPD
ncbi:MAG: polysaccharide biosynthesis/export family protein [Myxococcota bacterium]|nr:polysaccharide biosynthesis/export family protein [Myxococcota bacterium]